MSGSSGLDLSVEPLIPGYVSEYELRQSCLFAGYNWTQWLALDNPSRAMAVAHYRVVKTIELAGKVAEWESMSAATGRSNGLVTKHIRDYE